MEPTELIYEYRWSVEPEQAGQRLDRFLAPHLGHLSRTAIQRMIDEGMVLVNQRSSKPGYMIRTNDVIEVLHPFPASQPMTAAAREMPLDVVYEDKDLLVINKAAGMVVHPAPGHSEDTLVNALLARYPDLRTAGEEMRPGIVHRLDKDTSGLMIVARNAQAHAALAEQIKRHEVQKRYLALVEGRVALEQGSIDAPIGRDPRRRQQMTITKLAGKEARTHFWVLQRFNRHTLLLLQLETGRTHQIRVHLRAIGHPVAGDPVYGSGNSVRGVKLPRQFLHAYQLQFRHPSTGEVLTFEAPLPADLQAVLDERALL